MPELSALIIFAALAVIVLVLWDPVGQRKAKNPVSALGGGAGLTLAAITELFSRKKTGDN